MYCRYGNMERFFIVYMYAKLLSNFIILLLGIAVFGGVMETVVVIGKMYILDNENVYFNDGNFSDIRQNWAECCLCVLLSVSDCWRGIGS